MASSRATRLFGSLRAMHTSGRHIAHPPLGGAGTKASAVPPPQQVDTPPPAPSQLPDLTPTPDSASLTPSPDTPPPPTLAGADVPPADAKTDDKNASEEQPPKSRKRGSQKNRRPRTVPVLLPNGRPAPTSWPATQKWYDMAIQTPASEKPVHPLWKFFFLSEAAMETPSVGDEAPFVYGAMGPEWNNKNPGRAWETVELRLKSFHELHLLWYLCLRERNAYATAAHECKRLGMLPAQISGDFSRPVRQVRKTMARIKGVLQQRRLGLIAAIGPYLPKDESPALPQWADPMNQQRAIGHVLRTEAQLKKQLPTKAQLRKQLVERKRERVRMRAGMRAGMSNKPRAADKDTAAQPAADTKKSATVRDEQVAKEEVESRDEGFGGGKEAKEFVEGTDVESGKVKKTRSTRKGGKTKTAKGSEKTETTESGENKEAA